MSRQFASVIVMKASEAELDKNEANGVPRQPGDSVRFDDICYGNYDTECLVDVALNAIDHGESVATKAALDNFYSHIREYNSSLSGEMKGMLAKVLDLPIQKPSDGDGMMAVTLVNNPDEILKKMDAGGAKPLDNAVKPADVADVKNFVADMVYSDDMLFMDAEGFRTLATSKDAETGKNTGKLLSFGGARPADTTFVPDAVSADRCRFIEDENGDIILAFRKGFVIIIK